MNFRRQMMGVIARMAGSADVGGLTKYQKATVSYANGDITNNGVDLIFYHNLGVAPKFVIVYEAEGETATTGSFDQYACVYQAGYSSLINPNNMNRSRYVVVKRDSATLTNGTYYVDDERVKLHQSANTSHWDTGINYTIELWG